MYPQPQAQQQNQQPSPQWAMGDNESQVAMALAQHTTYILKYKTLIDGKGNERTICDEVLPFIEPFNADYPLAYLKNGQKCLAKINDAQNYAYLIAEKKLNIFNKVQLDEIKHADTTRKYDLIAKYSTREHAQQIKFCVDYFNFFSRKKLGLISHSRSTGNNPKQMRTQTSSLEPVYEQGMEQKKKGWF
jgi:hypothetical protein